MARAGLNLSAAELAKLAGVGYATVARFETGSPIAAVTRGKLMVALKSAGANFPPTKAGRVGVTVPM